MKTLLVASLVVIGSMGAALADDATIPNSTNQHGRDRADFYASVPDFATLTGKPKADDQAFEQVSTNTHDHRSVVIR
ncbi:hypothetical protein [Chenggangzhangella methanolivorans]|uniref:DUF4148 domain-containing protein n=1 Tax=Chenggangzhangella methanolivorans TaxID=1437009 RepID=A0A9E6UMT4_9HYPH|nr:hypothetical protein [Chenggangzhangella methanolivorans]QZO00331.1 hypothetical protein K6K41_00600 [Chenggangzhangella methanolivorans]